MKIDSKKFNTNDKWRGLLLSAYFSIALIIAVLPSFNNIGNLKIQILLTSFLAICISLVSMLYKNGVKLLGYGMSVFLVAMVIWALIAQIFAQLQSETPFEKWIYIFYYDKPMTILIMFVVVFLVLALVRLFSPFDEKYYDFFNDYKSFLKTSGISFLVFYFLLLVYTFIIIRTQKYSSQINLTPFASIKSSFQGDISYYEDFMYLFGNLLIFSPLGFFLLIFKKIKCVFVAIIPIALSCTIEISQLLLENGNCDIDDVILNSIGFYFGALLFYTANRIRKKVTKGEEDSIFHL